MGEPKNRAHRIVTPTTRSTLRNCIDLGVAVAIDILERGDLTFPRSLPEFQRQLGLPCHETAFQILHKLRVGMVRPDQDRQVTEPTYADLYAEKSQLTTSSGCV